MNERKLQYLANKLCCTKFLYERKLNRNRKISLSKTNKNAQFCSNTAICRKNCAILGVQDKSVLSFDTHVPSNVPHYFWNGPWVKVYWTHLQMSLKWMHRSEFIQIHAYSHAPSASIMDSSDLRFVWRMKYGMNVQKNFLAGSVVCWISPYFFNQAQINQDFWIISNRYVWMCEAGAFNGSETSKWIEMFLTRAKTTINIHRIQQPPYIYTCTTKQINNRGSHR